MLPTDTVYGIAADAFDADRVQALLAAKGRGREMPPPVLIGDGDDSTASPRRARGYAAPSSRRSGPARSRPWSAHSRPWAWDLGDTRGTVAVRMPDHEAALALLERTGPLAVSANKTARPPP